MAWSFSCDDGTTLSGGAPYENVISASEDATCVLLMESLQGDGWHRCHLGGFSEILGMAPRTRIERDLCGQTSASVRVAKRVPPSPRWPVSSLRLSIGVMGVMLLTTGIRQHSTTFPGLPIYQIFSKTSQAVRMPRLGGGTPRR